MNHSHQQNDCRANVTDSEEIKGVEFHLSQDRGEVGGESVRRKVSEEG